MMKLQVKTLNQKSLIVEIEDTKTVYDLKKELSLYPDIGVQPELQKLIYSGKILDNESQLTAYNIDVKKFIVVMTLKQPANEGKKDSSEPNEPKESIVQETVTASASNANASSVKDTEAVKIESTEKTAISEPKNEEMVKNIVAMGYPENEVRLALAASFYNPERAIEYLIEGIPDTANDVMPVANEGSEGEGETDLSSLESIRRDPLIRNLRHLISLQPDLMNEAIQQIAEVNPAMLNVINENQQEFLRMFLEPSDDEDESEDEYDPADFN